MPPLDGTKTFSFFFDNLFSVCVYPRDGPLTGTELGTSLSVYSLLLAKGCPNSSCHTDWEDDSKLTRARKDCKYTQRVTQPHRVNNKDQKLRPQHNTL